MLLMETALKVRGWILRDGRGTLRLPAIINLINQLLEPVIPPLADTHAYPQLTLRPEADCKRYEILCNTTKAVTA